MLRPTASLLTERALSNGLLFSGSPRTLQVRHLWRRDVWFRTLPHGPIQDLSHASLPSYPKLSVPEGKDISLSQPIKEVPISQREDGVNWMPQANRIYSTPRRMTSMLWSLFPRSGKTTNANSYIAYCFE
jgi:hypothetical protein